MYCRKCGQVVPDEDKFCASCGESKENNGTEAPEPDGKKRKKPKKEKSKTQKMTSNIGWGIFGLFLFVGIFGGDSTPPYTPPTYSATELVDYKNACETYDYQTIFRDSGQYIGKKATFTGKVVQAQYSGSKVILRVNVTVSESSFGTYVSYSDTIWVSYYPAANESRILEDDIITIYGELTGTYSYTSVLGGEITIPSIQAVIIEQSLNNGETATEEESPEMEETQE